MTTATENLEPPERVEIDRLMDRLGIDRRCGTDGDLLVNAISDFGTAEHIRGQRAAGEAITGILRGDLLAFDDGYGILTVEYAGREVSA